MGILARMGDMKAERPIRMKMTTWVTLGTCKIKIYTPHIVSFQDWTCFPELPKSEVSPLVLPSPSPSSDSGKVIVCSLRKVQHGLFQFIPFV